MTLYNIQSHINSLNQSDWNKLFDLIPIIEACDKFIVSGGIELRDDNPDCIEINPVIEAEVVLDFEQLMYDLDLVIGFGWHSIIVF